jgi:hypothetical protein
MLGLSLGVLLPQAAEFLRLYRSSDGLVLPNGKPYAGDFVCFYLAGMLFRTHLSALYDHSVMLELQKNFFPLGTDVGFLPFVYPPLMAFLFSGLSLLPFSTAANSWLALSAGLYVLALMLLLNTLRPKPLVTVALIVFCAAYAPFSVFCLAGGQTSAIGVLIFALVYYFLRRGAEFSAGAAAALSYYKPPLFLLFVVFLFSFRRRRFLKGFTIAALVLLSSSYALVGGKVISDFFFRLESYHHGGEILPGLRHSASMGDGLLSLLLEIFPVHPLAVNIAFLLAAAGFFFSLRKKPLIFPDRSHCAELDYALMTATSVLFSIWLMPYDYSLLVPAFILVLHVFFSEHERPVSAAWWISLLCLSGLFFSYAIPELPAGGVVIKSAPIFLLLWVLSLLHVKNSREILRAGSENKEL